MSIDRHIRLFDSIARPYSWFHRLQVRMYLTLLRRHLSKIGLPAGSTVLDVGCGPGSFGIAFKHWGFEVEGIDGSPKMAAIAASNGIECTVADATVDLPFADDSFDAVVAAYLAHGFSHNHRLSLFHEMSRVASNLVLLHDFSPASGGFPFTSITAFLELLEGSDYANFRRNGVGELEEACRHVTVLPVGKRVSWYVCDCF
jgi:ubiquinone/menaquinone biosynthesis C-methylase UbiE